MRILIIHTAFWSHYKAQIYTELYRQISKKNANIDFKVVHLATSEYSRAKLGAPDHSLHQYPYEVLYTGFIEDFGFKARLKALIKQIDDFKPNVINTPGYFDPAVVLIMAYCKAKGIKVVLSNDSTSSDQTRSAIKENVKRTILKLANGFFCYGSLSADYLLTLGVKQSQILSQKNAVDNRNIRLLFEQASSNRAATSRQLGLPERNFIFVGRLIDRLKNITGLLQAFKEVQQKSVDQPAWGLLILGTGEDQATLEKLIEEQGIKQVHFLGGKSWDEIPAYLALSDALVLPSYSEPWGLVVNEAMACGLPVLVSDRCGCAPDLVHHNKNGFIFDPYQPAQLSQYMGQLVSQPELAKQMGKLSEQYIASYSLEAVAAEMLQGFQTVFNHKQ